MKQGGGGVNGKRMRMGIGDAWRKAWFYNAGRGNEIGSDPWAA